MTSIPRKDYIEAVMARQGIQRNPRKYIVLQGWDTIIDHDVTYEIKVPPVPLRLDDGAIVYVPVSSDSPALVGSKVVEDRRTDGVFVEPLFNNPSRVQLLVSRQEVRMLPVPLRPTAILRADLKLFIGDEAATAWHEQRRARRDQRPAKE